MKRSWPKLSFVCFGLCGFLLTYLFLKNGEAAAVGVKRGLTLCFDTLFPSLFPFLVLSELLLTLQVSDSIGKYMGGAMRKLFGVSGYGATPLILGILCGFPTGAVTEAGLFDRGELSKEEFKRLFLFINNPGAGFLIGAVGSALFGNKSAGFALCGIVFLSAVMLGCLLRVLRGAVSKDEQPLITVKKERPLAASSFTGAVKRAGNTMLQVGVFVLFFSAVGACVAAIPAVASLPTPVRVMICGLLEITTGMAESVRTLPADTAFRFCAFFAGMSGLSVCLQVFSVTEGRELSILAYLGSKFLQGAICLLLCEIYLQLCKPVFQVSADVLWSPGTTSPLEVWWRRGILFVCVILFLWLIADFILSLTRHIATRKN